MRRFIIASVGLVLCFSTVSAQPQAAKEPLLRLEAGGPTGFVTSTVLSPDGKTLYAAGYDQVVRVWKLNARGEWLLDPFAFRVPIGPGIRGALNTLAISADGEWLAAGGNGFTGAGLKQVGFVVPVITFRSLFEDMGVIHVWNTRTRVAQVLRGHTGAVIGLTFAERQKKAPLLVSSAQDWDFNKSDWFGSVRLWDPSAEKPLLGQAPLPKATFWGKAGLTAWTTGEGPKQVQVAIGWGDKKFRRWDADTGQVSEWDDGQNNEPVAGFPDLKMFLSATFQNNKAGLRVWDRTAAEIPPPLNVAIFPDGYRPRAVGFISSDGGKKQDLVAAVVEAPKDANDKVAYELYLITRDPVAVVQKQLLWRLPATERSFPTLATAVQGRHLAVAGNNSHEIYIFPIEDLLKGVTKPIVEQSKGALYRYAAFVEKGNARGLVLNEKAKPTAGQAPRAPKDGDHIFDLTNRKLGSDVANWKVTAPELGDWTATAKRVGEEGKSRWAVVVRNGNDETATVTLNEGETITDFALTAPGKPYANPILVVAAESFLQPALRMYDTATGAQFMLCTGHTDVIRSLALSADGKLLVTAGDDQTVDVWSLMDLSHVGKRGLLTGLAVKEEGGKLKWVRAEKPADILPANRKALEDKGVTADDELEGIVEKGALRKFVKVGAYFDAVSRYQPGQKVTLRFAQRGDVELTVGQAIMEIKPLFTLFITRQGAAAEARDWIGWSPHGPYEYSNRQAERWIGWHFNPVKVDAAATFDSPAEQYHKEFYREGILRLLLQHGAIATAMQEWDREDMKKPLPKPVMRPWIEGTGPDPERAGLAVLVREQPKTLRLLVGNFPADRIAMLEWAVGDGARRPFAPGEGLERTADLAAVNWKRGPATVKVFLRTRAEEPQEYVEEVALRYQAPPPVLPDLSAKDLRRTVDQEKFALTLPVKPSGDKPAKVSFKQTFNDQEVPGPKPEEIKAPGDVKPTFTLKAGQNRIDVTAVNADAEAADAEWETSRLTLWVDYNPKPIPRVSLDSIERLLTVEPRTFSDAVKIPIQYVADVDRPTVRLTGVVRAEEELADVSWSVGNAPRRPLENFPEGKKEIEFRQNLTLNPGENVVRFYVKAKSGGEATQKMVITFKPELPRVQITTPARGKLVYDNGNLGPEPINARIIAADDQKPFNVALLINGKEQEKLEAPKPGAEELACQAKLTAGINRIELRVTNQWGAAQLSEAVTVRVLHPPVVKAEKTQGEVNEPLVSLSAKVTTVSPLDDKKIEVVVNDKPTPVAVELRGPAGAGGEWTVQLKDVPLTAGPNTVKMWVRNADARTRQAAEWIITYKPKANPVAPPEIEFADPPGDLRVTDAKLPVRLRIKSAEKLTRVELRRAGGNPVKIDVDTNVVPDANGVYDLKTDVELIPGPNPLRAIAVNAGGQRDVAIVASFLQEPVELVIERIVPKGMAGAPLEPQVTRDGKLVLDRPLATGQATLFGKVYWARDDDEQFKTAKQVRVFVNGFQQQPAELRPFRGVKKKNRPEREFSIDIALNRPTDNHIEVVLPGLKQRSANRREFVADCASPERIRILHVLPVVIRSKGEAKINTKEMVARLSKLIPSVATAKVKEYAPLTGYVSANEVTTQLLNIKAFLDATATDGGTGDLVVVYYQGGEVIETNGHFLTTSVSQQDKDLQGSAVAAESLTALFGETLGAQVLLLDVAREGKGDKLQDVFAQWPDQPNVSIFRYSRLSPGATRLLSDLKSEMGGATKLVDVAQHMGETFEWNSEIFAWKVPGTDNTLADWRIPVNLGYLRVK